MAGPPILAGRCRRVVLCALVALIGPGWSAGFGQMPPEGPMLVPDGQPMPVAGPNMPMPAGGPNMPMPALGPGVPMQPEWQAEIDAGKCVMGATFEE